MTAQEELAEAIAAHGKGRRDWYNEVYLKSRHWRDLRAAKFAIQGRKCERCPRRNTLQVHHNSYRSIFDVEVGDLEILCDECHSREHGKWRPDPSIVVIQVKTVIKPGTGKKARLAQERKNRLAKADRRTAGMHAEWDRNEVRAQKRKGLKK